MSPLSREAEALRVVRFFRELTDDDLGRLFRLGLRRTYQGGETLVERDSDSGGLFVILSGSVSVDAGGGPSARAR